MQDMIDLASSLVKRAEELGVELIIPTDVVVANEFSNDASDVKVSVTRQLLRCMHV